MVLADSVTQGLLIGLVVGAVFTVIGLTIAFRRKGTIAGVGAGKRPQTFEAAVSPEEALARIRDEAPGWGYAVDDAVDDAKETRKSILLSSKPSFVSWGFFFPVTLSPREPGGTAVRVGVKSKVFQYGPIVWAAQRKCVDRIRSALS